MTDENPVDQPHTPAPEDRVPDFTDEERDLTDALEAVTTDAPTVTPRLDPPVTPPAMPPATVDPVVREIVRRRAEENAAIRAHLPADWQDWELDQRREIWRVTREALQPAPDLGWIRGADAWREPPKPTEWLINDLITSSADGGRVLVAGPEKSFKSLFAVGCMVAVASGQPLFGFEHWSVPEAAPVLAFLGEGGSEWNRSRVIRVMEGQGFTDAQINATGDRLDAATRALTPPDRFVMKMEEELQKREYKLVVVDSLYVFSGDTERSQLAQMGTLLVKWSEVCEQAGATLMVVDHFRKDVSALELTSVSGVGASQWAQAWSLMKAKYNPVTDVARITALTGARQTAGGLYRITVSGVMSGPVMPKVEPIRPEDVDDDDVTGDPKTEAVIALNRYCSEHKEWVTVAKLGQIARTRDKDVIDHVLGQPHVAVRTSRNAKTTWVYAVDSSGGLPDPPKAATVEIKTATPPSDETGDDDDDG